MRLTKLSTHLASNPDKFTTDGTATTTATLNTKPYDPKRELYRPLPQYVGTVETGFKI